MSFCTWVRRDPRSTVRSGPLTSLPLSGSGVDHVDWKVLLDLDPCPSSSFDPDVRRKGTTEDVTSGR